MPCLKDMKDGGVIPKDKLDVKRQPAGKNTILIIKSQKPTEETPIFKSVKLTPGDIKEVKVTPISKDNKPAGKTIITPVSDSSKPTEVTFDKSIEAEKLIVILTPKSDAPTDVDVVSVVSCMPDQGVYSSDKDAYVHSY